MNEYSEEYFDEKNHLRILYVDSEVDERNSSFMLEKATELLPIICVFTVVGNIFLGFESIETSQYDMIFIREEVNQFSAFDVLKNLRKFESSIPLIILKDSSDNSPIASPDSQNLIFSLKFPFNSLELCDMIRQVLWSISKRKHSQSSDAVLYCAVHGVYYHKNQGREPDLNLQKKKRRTRGACVPVLDTPLDPLPVLQENERLRRPRGRPRKDQGESQELVEIPLDQGLPTGDGVSEEVDFRSIHETMFLD